MRTLGRRQQSRLPGLLLASVILLASPCAALGQSSYPMITHAIPAAIQRGQTAEVEVFGQMDFAGAYKAIFEGKGLRAEVLPAQPGAQKAGAPVKSVKMRVAALKDAVCGIREFRIVSDKGVSSIGQLVIVDEAVMQEKEPNNTISQAQMIALPAAICGRIEKSEDVDCYRFRAKAGVPVTFEVVCARLEDKIHDLQKHADPVLSITDGRGRELIVNDDHYFADSYLVFTAPADGDYFVHIRDVKYDGDPRWTYVLRATDRPHVSQAFPRVGHSGENLPVELMGSAARIQKSAVVALPPEVGIHDLPIPLSSGLSNSIPFLVTDLPQQREQEPNDKPGQAQALTIPCGLSGKIDKPHDVDCFSFRGKKGEGLAFEIKARRFGTAWNSSLDSMMEILDAKSKVLASNDDVLGKDSRLVFAPPADGIYYLRIRDLHHRGGDSFIYYLEATKAEPDFQLYFDPDKLAAGPGGSAACFVHLERLNGFAGAVDVTVESLPTGMAASPLRIPPTMTQGLVVVSASPHAQPAAEIFRVKGKATLKDDKGTKRSIVREAMAKEEIYLPGGGRGLFNVNTPVAVVTRAPDILAIQVEPAEIVLAPGQEVRLAVKIQRGSDFNKPVTLDVFLRHLGTVFGNPLPPGVTVVENKSKTLLGVGSEGAIVLKAAPDAKPIERIPIAVLANVSVNFMVKMSYSSPVVWLSVRK